MLQWSRGLSTAETPLANSSDSGQLKLQWSRGLSTAETVRLLEIKTAKAKLQWSRGLSTAETLTRQFSQRARPMWLQWSRGLSTAETLIFEVFSEPASGASMEPRSLDRGNLMRTRGPGRSRSGFNGAAVSRPRKPLGRSTSSRRRPGFNGAAVSRARKRAEGVPRGQGRDRAAREPRSLDRGNEQKESPVDKDEIVLQWSRGLSTAETLLVVRG